MNKLTLVLALLSLLIFSTCSKDFLEVEPLVGSTEVNYYQNGNDAEAAIIACYNPLQQEVTNIQGSGQLSPHFRWYFGDICSDDSEKGGSGDGDEPELLQFENFNGTANSKLILAEWQVAYKGIAYCNIALDKIPGIEMDEDDKNRFLAEAKFIRAYNYYTLVTMFGGVPLITEALSPSEYQQPRASANEIWNLIQTDLLEARNDLPKRSSISVSDLGRATWGAATSLLAKAYAYQNNWGSAYDMAGEVVLSNEYFLDPNFSNIFTLAGENGSGSIFEIQYMNASGGNWGNQLEGTFTNIFQRARGNFNGFGFNIPKEGLVSEFENNDPRLNLSIFREGDVMGDRGVFTLEATGFSYNYYNRKYFSNNADDAPFGDSAPNGPSNDRVIRLADVMLLYAEAAWHTGDNLTVRNMVNLVRERARGGNNSVLPDVNGQVMGDALLARIYHERRVELAMEGHRFFDLVRQGRAGDVLRAQGSNFIDGVHEIFPIPAAEITLSGGEVTQNPGY